MRTRLPKLLACALLAGAPLQAHAQPVQVNVDVNAAIGGAPINSVDVFYDQLAAYGPWLDDPQFGTVFAPADPAFQPYTIGHWAYTEVGMVWVSNQPFEWATSHYGRWVFSETYGRWVWIPDTTWGPSWVDWTQAGDAYGWAPLAPAFAISFGYTVPIAAWHFCGAGHLFAANVHRFFVPRAQVAAMHRDARPVDNFARVGGARVPLGPRADNLRAKGVQVTTTKVEARAVGRWQPQEIDQKVKRAQERRTEVEQKNRQRVERDPALQKAQARPAAPPAPGATAVTPPSTRPQPQPPKPEQTKPEPTKPEPQRTEPQRTEPQRTEPAQPPTQPQPTRPAPAKPEPSQPRATQPPPPAQQPPPREPPAPTKPEPQAPPPREPKQPPAPPPTQPPTQPQPPPKPEPQAPAPREPRPATPPPQQPAPPPAPRPQPTPQPAPPPPSPEPRTPPTPPPQPTPHAAPPHTAPSPPPSQPPPPEPQHGRANGQ
jgi:hypothetical protein